MGSFGDGQLSQSVLIAPDDLVLRNHLRCRENVGRHLDGVLIDDKVPVFDGLLVEKLGDHRLDPPDLLLWINPCLSKSVSHTWTFSDAVRHAVKKTKLSRQVVTLFSYLNKEHGLIDLSYPFFVTQKEVVSD